jgi:hypothetical protein
VYFKKGQKVRMVWKSVSCGGSNRGVIVATRPNDSKMMVKMKSGDCVIHDVGDTEACEVIREEDYPLYCWNLGADAPDPPLWDWRK